MKMLPVLLAVPLLANAAEADLACALERNHAEIRGELLKSPEAFARLGDPALGARSIVVGATQSLSGRVQAATLRDAAEARCSSLQASRRLEDHLRWSKLSVLERGNLAEQGELRQALQSAQANVEAITAQFATRNVTLMQVTEAQSVVDRIQGRLAELARALATPTQPPSSGRISDIIVLARAEEARAAGLTSKTMAHSGWDVSLGGGVKHTFGSEGETKPFVSVTAKLSFGYLNARSAAERIEPTTSAFIAAQEGGFAKVIEREREGVQRLRETETLRLAELGRHADRLHSMLKTLDGIETAVGQNVRRALRVEKEILDAQQAGVKARIEGYTAYLLQFEER